MNKYQKQKATIPATSAAFMNQAEVRSARERGMLELRKAQANLQADRLYRQAKGLNQDHAAKLKAVSDVKTHAKLADPTGWLK
jgi:hypothetical protein